MLAFTRSLLDTVLIPFQLLLPEPLLERVGIPTFKQIRTRRTLAHVRGSLLDAACGTNELVRQHRERGGYGVGSDVHAWRGTDLLADAATLPFGDATFDSVAIIAALNHIPHRERALAEARRVIRPGGKVIVTMIGPRTGRLNHLLAWCDPDLRERHAAADELPGLSRETVLSLAAATGLKCVREERFVAGLNTLYVLEPLAEQ